MPLSLERHPLLQTLHSRYHTGMVMAIERRAAEQDEVQRQIRQEQTTDSESDEEIQRMPPNDCPWQPENYDTPPSDDSPGASPPGEPR